MPSFKNIQGKRFGKWLVVSVGPSKMYSGKIKKFFRAWNCECECGTKKVITTNSLTCRTSTSCGCDRTRTITHGKSGTKLHRAWKLIKNRCLNPNCEKFHLYGGRGIRVNAIWINDFEAFAAHIGEPPTPEHWIDRIHSDGNYEPGNVRWATPLEQQNNRRNNVRVECDGKLLTVSQWSRELGLKPWKIRDVSRVTGETYSQVIHRLSAVQPITEEKAA